VTPRYRETTCQTLYCQRETEGHLKNIYKSAVWFYAYAMCQNETQLKSPDDFATISDYVAYIREFRGYTLRDVVKRVTTAIKHKALHTQCSLSRGYLSNLEAGKYIHPSPLKLQALAHVYQIPYESLLRKAGYWKTTENKAQQDILLTLMLKEVQQMKPEELQSLFEYIDFVKSKRTKRCKKCHHSIS
jgi:transcriptional regulator with XRE-family HTH domain